MQRSSESAGSDTDAGSLVSTLQHSLTAIQSNLKQELDRARACARRSTATPLGFDSHWRRDCSSTQAATSDTSSTHEHSLRSNALLGPSPSPRPQLTTVTSPLGQARRSAAQAAPRLSSLSVTGRTLISTPRPPQPRTETPDSPCSTSAIASPETRRSGLISAQPAEPRDGDCGGIGAIRNGGRAATAEAAAAAADANASGAGGYGSSGGTEQPAGDRGGSPGPRPDLLTEWLGREAPRDAPRDLDHASQRVRELERKLSRSQHEQSRLQRILETERQQREEYEAEVARLRGIERDFRVIGDIRTDLERSQASISAAIKREVADAATLQRSLAEARSRAEQAEALAARHAAARRRAEAQLDAARAQLAAAGCNGPGPVAHGRDGDAHALASENATLSSLLQHTVRDCASKQAALDGVDQLYVAAVKMRAALLSALKRMPWAGEHRSAAARIAEHLHSEHSACNGTLVPLPQSLAVLTYGAQLLDIIVDDALELQRGAEGDTESARAELRRLGARCEELHKALDRERAAGAQRLADGAALDREREDVLDALRREVSDMHDRLLRSAAEHSDQLRLARARGEAEAARADAEAASAVDAARDADALREELALAHQGLSAGAEQRCSSLGSLRASRFLQPDTPGTIDGKSVEVLTVELSDALRQAEALRNEVFDIKRDVARYQESAREVGPLRERAAAAERQLAALRASAAQEDSDPDALQAARDERDAALRKADGLRAEIAALLRRAEAAEREAAAAREEAGEFSRRMSNLQRELVAHRQDSAADVDLRAEISRLTELLNSANTELAFRDAQGGAAALRAAAAGAAAAQPGDGVDAAERAVADKRRQLRAAEDQVLRLRGELADGAEPRSGSREEQLRAELEDMQARVDALEREKSSALVALDAARAREPSWRDDDASDMQTTFSISALTDAGAVLQAIEEDAVMLEGEVSAHEQFATKLRGRLRQVGKAVQRRLQAAAAKVRDARTAAAEAADAANTARARAERLAAQLRAAGLEPDVVAPAEAASGDYPSQSRLRALADELAATQQALLNASEALAAKDLELRRARKAALQGSGVSGDSAAIYTAAAPSPSAASSPPLRPLPAALGGSSGLAQAQRLAAMASRAAEGARLTQAQSEAMTAELAQLGADLRRSTSERSSEGGAGQQDSEAARHMSIVLDVEREKLPPSPRSVTARVWNNPQLCHLTLQTQAQRYSNPSPDPLRSIAGSLQGAGLLTTLPPDDGGPFPITTPPPPVQASRSPSPLPPRPPVTAHLLGAARTAPDDHAAESRSSHQAQTYSGRPLDIRPARRSSTDIPTLSLSHSPGRPCGENPVTKFGRESLERLVSSGYSGAATAAQRAPSLGSKARAVSFSDRADGDASLRGMHRALATAMLPSPDPGTDSTAANIAQYPPRDGPAESLTDSQLLHRVSMELCERLSPSGATAAPFPDDVSPLAAAAAAVSARSGSAVGAAGASSVRAFSASVELLRSSAVAQSPASALRDSASFAPSASGHQLRPHSPTEPIRKLSSAVMNLEDARLAAQLKRIRGEEADASKQTDASGMQGRTLSAAPTNELAERLSALRQMQD